ncbi:MAG: hypothetical protein K0S74_1413 [Chlamydiales bacterium]|nr:hypothetical protein [Chlamydiales bacterium]
MAVSLITAIFTFFCHNNFFVPYVIYPDQQNLIIKFDIKLKQLKENKDLNSSNDVSCVKGCLRGKKQSQINEKVIYDCLLDELQILTEHNQLFLYFHRDGFYNQTYKIDPKWNEKERLEIYQLFHINWSNRSAFEDQSLLQQPFRLILTSHAQFEQLVLPPLLQKEIHSITRKLMGDNISKFFAYFFPNFPPFLPQSYPLTEQWTTSQERTLEFYHKIVEKKHGYWYIHSQSHSNIEKYRTLNQVKVGPINWVYDSIQHWIKQVHFEISIDTGKKLLGNIQSQSTSLAAELQISVEPEMPITDDIFSS